MKKILKGVFLSILAIIIIAGSVVAYLIFHQSNPAISNRPYITDNEGSSYLAVVGEDGVTYAVVTDANGNRYAAKINSDNSIGATVGNINEQVALEDLPTNFTGDHIDEINNLDNLTGNFADVDDPSYQPSESVTQPSGNGEQGNNGNTSPNQNSNTSSPSQNPGTTSSNNTTKPNNSSSTTGSSESTKLTAYRIEKYQKIFENGTYLIEFKTDDAETGNVPVTMATKNGDLALSMTMEGIPCKMIYYAKNKETYLAMDLSSSDEFKDVKGLNNLKVYVKMTDDMFGDEKFDTDLLESMKTNFVPSKIPKDKIKVKEVKRGGQKLICESYKLSDGSEERYYFNGETFVMKEMVNSDGTSNTAYISRITTNVPDASFEIPKGYMNLSGLMGLAGLLDK